MPDKSLLETAPLYKRISLLLPRDRYKWPTPAINAGCVVCGSNQTFNMLNDYIQYDVADPRPDRSGNMPPQSAIVRLVYGCASCSNERRYYLLLVTQNFPRRVPGSPAAPESNVPSQVMKVGQFPSWDIKPDPALAKKLGSRVKPFKDGLICESQGFGLGAFAYYRRIVEEVIDELLEDIHALVPPKSQSDYAEALRTAKASHRAIDKIEHVKDLVPHALRPGGVNPLALLHTLLSQGLHELPDEECLESASVLRDTMVHLVHQLNELKKASDQYAKGLQLLLERQALRARRTEAGEQPS